MLSDNFLFDCARDQIDGTADMNHETDLRSEGIGFVHENAISPSAVFEKIEGAD